MKQTAVQWLKQQYLERGETLPSGVFQDALDMERDQIIDAANQKIFGDITFQGSDEVITKGENYYNQTYKK